MFMLVVTDVFVLINYTSFVESTFVAATVGGLLWLRRKKPDVQRPIKVRQLMSDEFHSSFLLNFICILDSFGFHQVNLIYPISFFVVSIFLVCFPIFSSLMEVVTAVGIIVTAIPVFFFCIAWKNKPKWISSASSKHSIITSTISNAAISDFQSFQLRLQIHAQCFARKFF